MVTNNLLYNGILAFLTTLGTSFLAIAMVIPEGEGFNAITTVQWAIMVVGSFVTYMTQRSGFKAKPPEK